MLRRCQGSTHVNSMSTLALDNCRQVALHKRKQGRVRKTVTFKPQVARWAPALPKYFRWSASANTCELLEDERARAEEQPSEPPAEPGDEAGVRQEGSGEAARA